MLVSFGLYDAPEGLFYQQAMLRNEVFVEGQGWQQPVHLGGEFDEYDNPRSQYIVHKTGEIVDGGLRLVPTEYGTPSIDHFPQAFDGTPPRGPGIYENCRFCVSPHLDKQGHRDVFFALTLGYLDHCLRVGIEQVIIFTYYSGVTRGLAGEGVRLHSLGPIVKVDGHDCMAVITERIMPHHLELFRDKVRPDDLPVAV